MFGSIARFFSFVTKTVLKKSVASSQMAARSGNSWGGGASSRSILWTVGGQCRVLELA